MKGRPIRPGLPQARSSRSAAVSELRTAHWVLHSTPAYHCVLSHIDAIALAEREFRCAFRSRLSARLCLKGVDAREVGVHGPSRKLGYLGEEKGEGNWLSRYLGEDWW